MLLIECPFCGARNHDEFTYLGDATVTRPSSLTAKDEDWMNYVYLRDNPSGEHWEYWHHVGGCRTWLKVKRNVTSHAISAVFTAGSDEK